MNDNKYTPPNGTQNLLESPKKLRTYENKKLHDSKNGPNFLNLSLPNIDSNVSRYGRTRKPKKDEEFCNLNEYVISDSKIKQKTSPIINNSIDIKTKPDFDDSLSINIPEENLEDVTEVLKIVTNSSPDNFSPDSNNFINKPLKTYGNRKKSKSFDNKFFQDFPSYPEELECSFNSDYESNEPTSDSLLLKVSEKSVQNNKNSAIISDVTQKKVKTSPNPHVVIIPLQFPLKTSPICSETTKIISSTEIKETLLTNQKSPKKGNSFKKRLCRKNMENIEMPNEQIPIIEKTPRSRNHIVKKEPKVPTEILSQKSVVNKESNEVPIQISRKRSPKKELSRKNIVKELPQDNTAKLSTISQKSPKKESETLTDALGDILPVSEEISPTKKTSRRNISLFNVQSTPEHSEELLPTVEKSLRNRSNKSKTSEVLNESSSEKLPLDTEVLLKSSPKKRLTKKNLKVKVPDEISPLNFEEPISTVEKSVKRRSNVSKESDPEVLRKEILPLNTDKALLNELEKVTEVKNSPRKRPGRKALDLKVPYEISPLNSEDSVPTSVEKSLKRQSNIRKEDPEVSMEAPKQILPLNEEVLSTDSEQLKKSPKKRRSRRNLNPQLCEEKIIDEKSLRTQSTETDILTANSCERLTQSEEVLPTDKIKRRSKRCTGTTEVPQDNSVTQLPTVEKSLRSRLNNTIKEPEPEVPTEAPSEIQKSIQLLTENDKEKLNLISESNIPKEVPEVSTEKVSLNNQVLPTKSEQVTNSPRKRLFRKNINPSLPDEISSLNLKESIPTVETSLKRETNVSKDEEQTPEEQLKGQLDTSKENSKVSTDSPKEILSLDNEVLSTDSPKLKTSPEKRQSRNKLEVQVSEEKVNEQLSDDEMTLQSRLKIQNRETEIEQTVNSSKGLPQNEEELPTDKNPFNNSNKKRRSKRGTELTKLLQKNSESLLPSVEKSLRSRSNNTVKDPKVPTEILSENLTENDSPKVLPLNFEKLTSPVEKLLKSQSNIPEKEPEVPTEASKEILPLNGKELQTETEQLKTSPKKRLTRKNFNLKVPDEITPFITDAKSLKNLYEIPNEKAEILDVTSPLNSEEPVPTVEKSFKRRSNVLKEEPELNDQVLPNELEKLKDSIEIVKNSPRKRLSRKTLGLIESHEISPLNSDESVPTVEEKSLKRQSKIPKEDPEVFVEAPKEILALNDKELPTEPEQLKNSPKKRLLKKKSDLPVHEVNITEPLPTVERSLRGQSSTLKDEVEVPTKNSSEKLLLNEEGLPTDKKQLSNSHKRGRTKKGTKIPENSQALLPTVEKSLRSQSKIKEPDVPTEPLSKKEEVTLAEINQVTNSSKEGITEENIEKSEILPTTEKPLPSRNQSNTLKKDEEVPTTDKNNDALEFEKENQNKSPKNSSSNLTEISSDANGTEVISRQPTPETQIGNKIAPQEIDDKKTMAEITPEESFPTVERSLRSLSNTLQKDEEVPTVSKNDALAVEEENQKNSPKDELQPNLTEISSEAISTEVILQQPTPETQNGDKNGPQNDVISLETKIILPTEDTFIKIRLDLNEKSDKPDFIDEDYDSDSSIESPMFEKHSCVESPVFQKEDLFSLAQKIMDFNLDINELDFTKFEISKKLLSAEITNLKEEVLKIINQNKKIDLNKTKNYDKIMSVDMGTNTDHNLTLNSQKSLEDKMISEDEKHEEPLKKLKDKSLEKEYQEKSPNKRSQKKSPRKAPLEKSPLKKSSQNSVKKGSPEKPQEQKSIGTKTLENSPKSPKKPLPQKSLEKKLKTDSILDRKDLEIEKEPEPKKRGRPRKSIDLSTSLNSITDMDTEKLKHSKEKSRRKGSIEKKVYSRSKSVPPGKFGVQTTPNLTPKYKKRSLTPQTMMLRQTSTPTKNLNDESLILENKPTSETEKSEIELKRRGRSRSRKSMDAINIANNEDKIILSLESLPKTKNRGRSKSVATNDIVGNKDLQNENTSQEEEEQPEPKKRGRPRKSLGPNTSSNTSTQKTINNLESRTVISQDEDGYQNLNLNSISEPRKRGRPRKSEIRNEIITPIGKSKNLISELGNIENDLKLIQESLGVDIDTSTNLDESKKVDSKFLRRRKSEIFDSNREKSNKLQKNYGSLVLIQNDHKRESSVDSFDSVTLDKRLGNSNKRRLSLPIKIESNIKKIKTNSFEIVLHQIVWAKVGVYPYWPAMVAIEAETQTYEKSITQGRDPHPRKCYHVKFFGDNGRRSWISKNYLFPFQNRNDLKIRYEDAVKNFNSALKPKHYNHPFGFKVLPKIELKWSKAVTEAEILMDTNPDDRVEKFDEILIGDIKPIKRKIETTTTNQTTDQTKNELKMSPSPKKRKIENQKPQKKTEINEFELVEEAFGSILNENNNANPPKKVPSNENLSVKSEKITRETPSPIQPNKKRNINLFKGIPEGNICVICLKPGKVLRCKGVCFGLYHQECDKSRNKSNGIDLNLNLDNGEVAASDSCLNSDLLSNEEKDLTTNKALNLIEDSSNHCESKSVDFATCEKLDAKLSEVMLTLLEEKTKYAESTTDSSESDSNLDSKDSNFDIKETVFDPKETKVSKNGKNVDKNGYKCTVCLSNQNPPCFVCTKDISKLGIEDRIKCMWNCGKFYHKDCLKEWPQTKWILKNNVEILNCPYHNCHTCISDDPRANVSKYFNEKLVKCIKCPSAYHKSIFCIPAGSEILSKTQIICPKHSSDSNGKKNKPSLNHVNAAWCFICAMGGSLICCENCPASFHSECLKMTPPDGGYICEECESGRLPLYNEVVWVKLGAYRWWPARILFPTDVPSNIRSLPHSQGDFVVKFFGSHDHYWVNRGRAFLFQDGDTGNSSSKKSSVDSLFLKAIEEARKAHTEVQVERANKTAEFQSVMKPPPFIRLLVNRPVGNVKMYEADTSNTTPCDCDPNSEQPCGPDSDCLNRLLMTECDPMVCAAGQKCQNQAFEKRQYAPIEPFKTSARGWGLKASKDIEKGSFIIEYVGEVITEEEYRKRMQRKHEQKDENYYFLTIDKDRMIDAGPKGNLARFMNHSCSPNCETQKWTVNGDTRVGLFAICDIPAETELTFNYNLECTGEEKKICHCGAKNCSGFIGVKVKNEVKQSTKKYKKKKKIVPQENLSITKENSQLKCFVCNKKGAEQTCTHQNCDKNYHLECLNMDFVQEGRWICPRHNCQICDKRTCRTCSKCLKSYCPKHSDGKIFYIKNDFFCLDHKTSNSQENIIKNESFSNKKSQKVNTKITTSPKNVENENSKCKTKASKITLENQELSISSNENGSENSWKSSLESEKGLRNGTPKKSPQKHSSPQKTKKESIHKNVDPIKKVESPLKNKTKIKNSTLSNKSPKKFIENFGEPNSQLKEKCGTSKFLSKIQFEDSNDIYSSDSTVKNENDSDYEPPLKKKKQNFKSLRRSNRFQENETNFSFVESLRVQELILEKSVTTSSDSELENSNLNFVQTKNITSKPHISSEEENSTNLEILGSKTEASSLTTDSENAQHLELSESQNKLPENAESEIIFKSVDEITDTLESQKESPATEEKTTSPKLNKPTQSESIDSRETDKKLISQDQNFDRIPQKSNSISSDSEKNSTGQNCYVLIENSIQLISSEKRQHIDQEDSLKKINVESDSTKRKRDCQNKETNP